MISQDLLGIIAFALFTFLFFIVGYKEKVFAVLCSGIILGYGLSVWQFMGFSRFPEAVLVIIGLVLYCIGCINLRMIITRSVSLHVLMNPNSKQLVDQFRVEIGKRVVDITRYKLGVLQDAAFNLTLLGKFIASVVSFIYAVFGIKR